MSMVWWHWMLIGISLLGLELLFPSFAMVWFGLGALLTGIVMPLLPAMHPVIQILGWFAVSLCFTLLWYKYLKPKKEKNTDHHNLTHR